MNRYYKNIMLAGCLLWAGSANAGFYIIHNAPEKAKPQVHAVKNPCKVNVVANPCGGSPVVKKATHKTVPHFSVSSNKGAGALQIAALDSKHAVEGRGENISLTMLAKQVIPKGWSFRCDNAACDERVITWNADTPTPWRDILNGGFASVNKDGLMNITINSNQRFAAVSTKFVPKTKWLINGNQTLHENLEAIVKQSNYSFKWSMGNRDWEMGHTQYLHGDMQGVLDQIMQAYNDKGVMITYLVQGNVIEIVHRSSMADITYNKNASSEVR